MLKNWFYKIVLFMLAFGIIIQIIPKASSNTEQNESSLDLIFYSSYNYQTLTASRLENLNTDFYMPVYHDDILLEYQIESPYLKISEETMTIPLRTNDGYVDTLVYHVQIVKSPSIWKQEVDFQIHVHYLMDGQAYESIIQGQVNATMPDDFLGGTVYTIIKYSQMFVEGALRTIVLALVGTIAGFFLSMFLVTGKLIQVKENDQGLIRFSKILISRLSSTYITIFRGTPMIVQASFFWYGFGLFGDPFYCGLFVVSINTAAYIAEILRGGIQSIDPGQKEASESLGMSHIQTMVLVIFPQAIKNSLPAIGNEFIVNIKDTAVLSVIGIFELFNQGRKITGMHYRQLEVYLIIAMIYLFLTYSISSLLKLIERRMDLQPLEITSSN
jgi:putative lysine transport system permease protein